MHLSVHASGQIHMRIGGKDLQHLAPPLSLGQGQSLHAFEVKFLVGPDALLPKPRPDRRKAFLIETPEGFSLVLNLVLGMPGTDGAVPPEFLPAGETIWRARLPDSRPVTLVGRVLQMSAEDEGELEYIRRELKPKITFSGKPSNPYIETRHVHWSPTGGNVIVVIPLGPEGFRVDPSPITADHTAGAEKRILHLSSSNARIPVIAPDRAIVAHMEVKGVESSLELVKEQPTEVSFGDVSLSIVPEALRFGEKFRTPSYDLSSVPRVDGLQPKTWAYPVSFTFDGKTLKAEVRCSSCSLRNVNFPQPMPNVRDDEEVLIAAPMPKNLVLAVTAPNPTVSLPLIGKITLRSH